MHHSKPTVLGFARSSYFAVGSGGKEVTPAEIFENKDVPVAFFGPGHSRVYQTILENKLDFYFLDTGYLGNIKTKIYKRIVKNGINDSRDPIQRPRDRLDRLIIDREKYKRGDNILLIPPDQKILNCFDKGCILSDWIEKTVKTISEHTDRKVIVRERQRNRALRLYHDRFVDALRDDVHAVAVWSSNCSTESIIHGIPVISLGPTATKKVSPFLLDQIDQVPNLDEDLVELWLRHLSYSQFTVDEMLSGLAWNYVNQ